MACAGRILRKTLVGEGFGWRRTLQQHRQQQRLRLIASWTKIEIEIPYTANTTPTTTKKKLQLQIQEQLTSPPPSSSSSSSSSSFSSSSPRSTNTSFDRTGRRIWPCAIPLLKTILKEVSYEDASATTTITNTQMNKHNDNNDKALKRSPRTVLELGAGCGVVGMGLAASGFFQHVCMTDVDIDWLQQNIHQNYKFQSSNTNNHKTSSTQQKQQHSIENNSSIISEGVHVESQRLPWGHPFHSLESSLASHLQHGQLSKRNKAYHWDYIVGSDLLYDVNAHNDLLWTLDHYAMTSLTKSRNRYRNTSSSSRSCNEKDGSRLQEEMLRTSNDNENDDITGTQILLAYPRRADDTEQFFLSQIRSMGIFHVEVHDLSLLQDDNNEDNDPKDQNVKTPSPLGLMRLVKKDSF